MSVVPTIVRAPAGRTKNRRLSRGERSTSARPPMRDARGVEHQVDAEGGAQAVRPAGEEAVCERAGGADHDARPRLDPVAGLAVDEPDADDAALAIAAAVASTRTWLAPVAAGGLGVEDVLEHEPRVVGLAVDVGLGAGEPRGAQVRRQLVELRAASLRPRAGGRHSASAL